MSLLSLAVVGQGFVPPGPGSFELPPLVEGIPWLNKALLLGFVALVLVAGFFLLASRKESMVPGKLQLVGEMGYGFVRNTLARDMIGSADFLKFVPYLVGLFFFILVSNIFGLVPFIQFPTFGNVGWAYAFAAVSWIMYNAVGIQRKGFGGYLRHQTMPSGVPSFVLPLVIMMEFFSNIVVRPFTLSLRLFANMFAGHLLLLVFIVGGEYLMLHADSIAVKPVGAITFLLAIALSFLELLIEVLQAFIFTILTAQYIGGALSEEH